jgi:hypothetical protein
MRLNNTLQRQIAFARFCIENECEPRDLATAIDLADKSARAWKRDDFEAEQKYGEACRDIIETRLNCSGVYWAGLYPTFKNKAGYDQMLPGWEWS